MRTFSEEGLKESVTWDCRGELEREECAGAHGLVEEREFTLVITGTRLIERA